MVQNNLANHFKLDSEIIRYLRYPLIAWVVFAHSSVCNPDKLMELGFPISSYLLGFLTIGFRNPIFLSLAIVFS